ncbi:unnamed protein product [Nezara viridula]|uniref:Uncharacterized protein n=1 Tax=Nezara viridula TaxID=85310 RepID=A0A9P0H0E9_NEZVI|nr:unnamed protein product [Nezara viridula]
MADEIVSAMEMVEEQAIKCPRPSAKRQRKGSPDAREETDKERVDDSLLQDARRIKENIRVYMNATDRNVSAKVQKHVNGKIQQLIDIMETIYDKNYEKTVLVQRVVKDTLASSEMYDIIVNALVEKAVPMVIEGIKRESKTIQRPLSEPQTSREFPCIKEQPLLADALLENTENESFQEVKKKQRRKKALPQVGKDIEASKPIAEESLTKKRSTHQTSMADIVKELPLKPMDTTRPTYVTIASQGKSAVDIINNLPSPTELGIKARVVRATKAGSVLVCVDEGAHAKKNN